MRHLPGHWTSLFRVMCYRCPIGSSQCLRGRANNIGDWQSTIAVAAIRSGPSDFKPKLTSTTNSAGATDLRTRLQWACLAPEGGSPQTRSDDITSRVPTTRPRHDQDLLRQLDLADSPDPEIIWCGVELSADDRRSSRAVQVLFLQLRLPRAPARPRSPRPTARQVLAGAGRVGVGIMGSAHESSTRSVVSL